MIRFFLFALLLVPPFSPARAGGYDHENGGNLLVCPRAGGPGRASVALLDLFEGRRSGLTFEGLRRHRGRALESAFPSVVASALRRNREVADLFLSWFARRDAELLFVEGPLPRISHRSPYRLPAGCRLEQAAVQTLFPFPSPANRIRLDRSIWFGTSGRAPLATDLKVALLFHEYVLRWQDMIWGPCSQARVRAITAFLLSDQSPSVPDSRWRHVISEDELPASGACLVSPQL